jgi:hypothetical protein
VPPPCVRPGNSPWFPLDGRTEAPHASGRPGSAWSRLARLDHAPFQSKPTLRLAEDELGMLASSRSAQWSRARTQQSAAGFSLDFWMRQRLCACGFLIRYQGRGTVRRDRNGRGTGRPEDRAESGIRVRELRNHTRDAGTVRSRERVSGSARRERVARIGAHCVELCADAARCGRRGPAKAVRARIRRTKSAG